MRVFDGNVLNRITRCRHRGWTDFDRFRRVGNQSSRELADGEEKTDGVVDFTKCSAPAPDFLIHAAQRNSACYTVPDMEEEAIITAVGPGPQRVIHESLRLGFLHISFRVSAVSKYQNKMNKATLKSPEWLSELQASAPIDGYAMKNGEFTVSLPKDDRIKEDLRVILEVSDWDVLSQSP